MKPRTVHALDELLRQFSRLYPGEKHRIVVDEPVKLFPSLDLENGKLNPDPVEGARMPPHLRGYDGFFYRDRGDLARVRVGLPPVQATGFIELQYRLEKIITPRGRSVQR